MPLPASTSRKPMHTRTIVMDGYEREDGLFDIDGRITDVKTTQYITESERVVEPGEALHDMSIRLVVDAAMTVQEIHAVTDSSPHPACPEATANLQRLKGLNLMKGWRVAIREQLAGAEGCAHLKELLNAMGSGAFQALTVVRKRRIREAGGESRPGKLETCLAYSSSGPLVERKWPQFFIRRSG